MEISKYKKQIANRSIARDADFKGGYTLVEILVTLAIISSLFIFGYVSFRDFSRRQVLSDASKTIEGDLRTAQGDASTGQKPNTAVCNSPNTLNSYDIKIIPNSEYKIEANCSGSVNPVLIKDVTLSPDITISNASPNPLVFNILGQGTNSDPLTPWTLTLTQAGTSGKVSITVTSGGQIQ